MKDELHEALLRVLNALRVLSGSIEGRGGAVFFWARWSPIYTDFDDFTTCGGVWHSMQLYSQAKAPLAVALYVDRQYVCKGCVWDCLHYLVVLNSTNLQGILKDVVRVCWMHLRRNRCTVVHAY